MSTGDVRHYSLSDKDTWQTPQWLIELLKTYVSIDFDPCAGKRTAIGEYYNLRLEDGDDGIEQSWDFHPHPYVDLNGFINPPFGYKRDWVHKTIQEYRAGHVNLAILLTSASPTVKSWFQGERGDTYGIMDEADYIWFPNGRINFYDPDKGEIVKGATGGSMLSFFGEIPDDCIEALETPSDRFDEHDGGVVWNVGGSK